MNHWFLTILAFTLILRRAENLKSLSNSPIEKDGLQIQSNFATNDLFRHKKTEKVAAQIV